MEQEVLREWKKEDRGRAYVDWVQSLPQVPGAAVSTTRSTPM
jgi:hypothetical protein